MKILVIGTPKSGKTRFINKKIKEYPNLLNLDNLPKKYIKKTGLALGRLSDYRVDIMFTCHVLELENKHKDDDYIISSGPLYTYSHFVAKANYSSEEKAIQALWPAMFLSNVITDSFWYDEIYYLPYRGEDEYNQILDKAIQQSIKNLGLQKRVTTVE